MYSHRFRALLGSLVVLWLAGCATTKIRTDYDKEASFRQLRTYDWADVAGGSNDSGGSNGHNGAYGSNGSLGTDSDEPSLSPLLQRHILRVADAELALRGYRKARSGAPDFRIAYRVNTSERVSVGPGYGYSPYMGYRGFGHGHLGHGHFGHGHLRHRPFGHGRFGYGAHYGSFYAPVVREYLRTTLILDIFDTRTGKLIWRGWARSDLAADPEPEEVQEYVDQAVHKILKRFPPET
jgi:hypothetical protein